MNELEKLNFTLNEKEKELERIKTDLFILNPQIQSLCSEIKTIKEKIKELENKEDN